MKRIIVSLLLVFVLVGFTPATIAITSTDAPQVVEVAKRGCCSWHGGVCGCQNGRAVCCDGTLSPTCGCD